MRAPGFQGSGIPEPARTGWSLLLNTLSPPQYKPAVLGEDRVKCISLVFNLPSGAQETQINNLLPLQGNSLLRIF